MPRCFSGWFIFWESSWGWAAISYLIITDQTHATDFMGIGPDTQGVSVMLAIMLMVLYEIHSEGAIADLI